MNNKNLKNTNPKDIIGNNKLPLHLVPRTSIYYCCLALLDGALKYGRTNWRKAGVRASIYYDACNRHLDRWFEGEIIDPDSGLPHLAHAIACITILIDATEKGNLKDDRMYPTNFERMLKKLSPHVERLRKLYKKRNPKHWTIKDKKRSKNER